MRSSVTSFSKSLQLSLTESVILYLINNVFSLQDGTRIFSSDYPSQALTFSCGVQDPKFFAFHFKEDQDSMELQCLLPNQRLYTKVSNPSLSQHELFAIPKLTQFANLQEACVWMKRFMLRICFFVECIVTKKLSINSW